jgi:hypothetical protein
MSNASGVAALLLLSTLVVAPAPRAQSAPSAPASAPIAPGVWIFGRIAWDDDGPMPASLRLRRPGHPGPLRAARVDVDGEFLFGPLPAGEYVVTAEFASGPPVVVAELTAPLIDVGLVRPPALGTLFVRLVGALAGHPNVELQLPGGLVLPAVPEDDGYMVIGAVGRHELRVTGRFAPIVETVDLRVDDWTTITLALRPGYPCRMTFAGPSIVPGRVVRLVVVDEEGRAVVRTAWRARDKPPQATFRLGEGRHRVVCEVDDGSRVDAFVDVVATDDDVDQDFVLVRR